MSSAAAARPRPLEGREKAPGAEVDEVDEARARRVRRAPAEVDGWTSTGRRSPPLRPALRERTRRRAVSPADHINREFSMRIGISLGGLILLLLILWLLFGR